MNASLVIIKSDGSNARVPIPDQSVVVGRDRAAGLRIPVASVSRKHCEFFIEDGTVLVIRDLGSSNGTFVNKERIEEAELDSGDLVSIGSVVLAVQIGDESNIDPAQAFRDGIVDLTPADSDESGEHGGESPTKVGDSPIGMPARSPEPLAADLADDDDGMIDNDALDDSPIEGLDTQDKPAAPPAPSLGKRGDIAGSLAAEDDSDGSSFIDFDFDLDDDDEDQPKL